DVGRPAARVEQQSHHDTTVTHPRRPYVDDDALRPGWAPRLSDGGLVVRDERVGPGAHLVFGALGEHDVLRRPVRVERTVPAALHADGLAGLDVDGGLQLVVH